MRLRGLAVVLGVSGGHGVFLGRGWVREARRGGLDVVGNDTVRAGEKVG